MKKFLALLFVINCTTTTEDAPTQAPAVQEGAKIAEGPGEQVVVVQSGHEPLGLENAIRSRHSQLASPPQHPLTSASMTSNYLAKYDGLGGTTDSGFLDDGTTISTNELVTITTPANTAPGLVVNGPAAVAFTAYNNPDAVQFNSAFYISTGGTDISGYDYGAGVGINVHNATQYDTSYAENWSFGGFFETVSTKSISGNDLDNVGIYSRAANGDHNYSFWGYSGVLKNNDPVVIGSDTAVPFGTSELTVARYQNNASTVINMNTNAGAAALAESVLNNDLTSGGTKLRTYGTGFTTSGAAVQDGGEVRAASNLSGGLSLTAEGGVVRIYAGGSDAAHLHMTIDANGHITTNAPAATLTNATCNSAACTEVSGVFTTTNTTATVTFSHAYPSANDTGCSVEPVNHAVVPTCNPTASSIACSVVVSGAKYRYFCMR
jgi:hypothetical protein